MRPGGIFAAMRKAGRRVRVLLVASVLLAAAWLPPLSARADGAPAAEAGQADGEGKAPEADAWLARMVSALRTSGTLAARIRADTVDYLGGRSQLGIELIRDAREPTMHTVVEVREPDTEAPVLFRLDSAPDGTVTSWTWDIRFQSFVHVVGLEGPEPFAGTHFRLEDLGYTGLLTRRGGVAEREGDEVRITSGPYESYGRVVSHLDPATGMPRRTEIYDVTGALIWRIAYEEVRDLGGRRLPTRMTTRNPVSREETVLSWERVLVDAPVPPEVFDLERLEVAMRRGDDPVVLPGRQADGPAPAAAPGTPSRGGR